MTTLDRQQQLELISILKERFLNNLNRHPELSWQQIEDLLLANKEKMEIVARMESSGGEPDVTTFGDSIVYVDFSAESPLARRSLCYDDPALQSRKANKPAGSALEVASSIGAELLNEEQYKHIQTFGKLDCKTSSWIKTPAAIRDLGGALFGDSRFNHVFIYHNGAESYYAARGFRTFIAL